jgi:hypothetical protein
MTVEDVPAERVRFAESNGFPAGSMGRQVDSSDAGKKGEVRVAHILDFGTPSPFAHFGLEHCQKEFYGKS